jgi:4,5-DOPA dioxygenase extradiol
MTARRAPALFVSHGAPTELIRAGAWQTALEYFGLEVRPRAVVVMSAHWRSRSGFDVGYQSKFSTIHDFSGFPEALNQFAYPAAGDLNLAEQCVELLRGAAMPSVLVSNRGLDHGAYVPLVKMWPKADIPVIPVAISASAPPEDIFRAGEILAPLRREGVVIMGSGGMVHNLGDLAWNDEENQQPDSWAEEFHIWVRNALIRRDFNSLCGFLEQAPQGSRAHPTWEHFAPLLFACGASSAWDESFDEIYSSWSFKNLSMSCFTYGTWLSHA